jgi:hypothetical protein
MPRLVIMNRFILWIVLALSALHAGAQSIDGTWVFDKAVDYEGLTPSPTPPISSTLRLANGQIISANNCVVTLRQKNYSFNDPFQAHLKAGRDEEELGKFLLKQFNFNLAKIKVYYEGDGGIACGQLNNDFLVSDEKLISVVGSYFFYVFKREKPIPTAIDALAVDLRELKISRLPFDVNAYINTCLIGTPKRNGVPQENKRCGSAFVPYIVGPDTKNPLLKVVGAHAFIKGGARGASEDYDNPVSNGLHPVVLVFPPLKGVVLVRVNDIEGGNDMRDTMSGVYLAIKNGKVTDQLNEGCGFDLDFVCSSPSQTIKYKLLETGKFARQN